MTRKMVAILLGVAALAVVLIAGFRGCGKPGNPFKKADKEEISLFKSDKKSGEVEEFSKKEASAQEKVKRAEEALRVAQVGGNAKKIAEAERKKAEAEAELKTARAKKNEAEGVGGKVSQILEGLKKAAGFGLNKGSNFAADYLKEQGPFMSGRKGLNRSVNGFIEKNATPDEENETLDGPDAPREPKPGETFLYNSDTKQYFALSQDGKVTPVTAPPAQPVTTAPTTKKETNWFLMVGVGIGILFVIGIFIALIRKRTP